LERGRKLLQSLLPVQPDGKRANNQGNSRVMRRIPKPFALMAVASHARAKIRRVKLLIVDDHPLFRDGLAALLRQADDRTVLLLAVSTQDALDIVDEQVVDAVFMDLIMPGLSGGAVLA